MPFLESEHYLGSQPVDNPVRVFAEHGQGLCPKRAAGCRTDRLTVWMVVHPQEDFPSVVVGDPWQAAGTHYSVIEVVTSICHSTKGQPND